MEFWEFLLQKEGDRSWLPLESPKVEILEGRYRVVARSSRVHTPVEIRITHDSITEMPPVRRTQKRTGKTNRDGLVVIIPFTRLLPGMWELRCTSELMADMLGEGWQYAVQFQIEPETAEEWEPDWQDNVTGAEAVEADQGEADQGEADQITAHPAELGSTLSEQPALTSTTESITGSIAAEAESPTLLTAATELPTGLTPAQATNDLTIAEAVNSDLTNLVTPEPATLEAAAAEPIAPREATAPPSPEDQTPSPSANLLPLRPLSTTDSSATRVSAGWDQVPPMRLRLAQDTYVVQGGQPLSVIGQVEHLAGLLTDPIPVGELHIRLYDPRTSRVLVDQRQPLTPRRLPFPFSCQITLPDHYQTYLLLGEVALYGIPTAESLPELATQSFTVTTDLHELLESIANDFPEPDLPPPATPEPQQAENIAFLNLAATAQVTLEFRPSTSPILPPKLHKTDPERSPKAPQLPPLPRSAASPVTQPEAVAEQETAPATEAPATEAAAAALDLGEETDLIEAISAIEADFSADAIPDAQITEAVREEQPGLEAASIPPRSNTNMVSGEASSTVIQSTVIQSLDDEDPIPDWYEEENHLPQWQRQWQQSSPQAAEQADPKEAAFRALNLQERFWDRLQALIHDRELMTWLQSETDDVSPEATEPPASGTAPLIPAQSKQTPVGLDAALAAQEVVAEDALAPARPSSDHPDQSTDGFQPALALVLPLEQPIPAPVIELRSRELVAGQSFNLTVKLPNIPARLYAKLWLRDRQSRTLLSGPHWLTEFVPDGFGSQIIRTALTVPKGCLEVQVEAITVEMPTQRESDKVSVAREVIPPNLSAFSLDDFEI